MNTPSPVNLHILWGANPESDLPDTYELANEACVAAFLKGVDEADGWQGVNWVPHENHRVNRDGDIVEKKGTLSEVTDCERFVIWGESPEVAAETFSYKFDTPEEAEAFQLGASEAVGWTAYCVVPGPEFRRIDDPEGLHNTAELDWLTAAGRQHLLTQLAQDELPSTFYAMPNGEWANELGERHSVPSPAPDASKRRRAAP